MLDILTTDDVAKLEEFCVDIESTQTILNKIRTEKEKIRNLEMCKKSEKEVIDTYTSLCNLEQKLRKEMRRNRSCQCGSNVHWSHCNEATQYCG